MWASEVFFLVSAVFRRVFIVKVLLTVCCSVTHPQIYFDDTQVWFRVGFTVVVYAHYSLFRPTAGCQRFFEFMEE